ncbi:MAG: hypothetical protein IJV80_02305 [Clostridia bacterium]|nr:hypothetical protein [Clostridia bacterium]
MNIIFKLVRLIRTHGFSVLFLELLERLLNALVKRVSSARERASRSVEQRKEKRAAA